MKGEFFPRVNDADDFHLIGSITNIFSRFRPLGDLGSGNSPRMLTFIFFYLSTTYITEDSTKKTSKQVFGTVPCVHLMQSPIIKIIINSLLLFTAALVVTINKKILLFFGANRRKRLFVLFK